MQRRSFFKMLLGLPALLMRRVRRRAPDVPGRTLKHMWMDETARLPKEEVDRKMAEALGRMTFHPPVPPGGGLWIFEVKS